MRTDPPLTHPANTIDLAITTLNANAPQHAQPRTFSLTAEELQTLNTDGQVTIDLKKHALFPSFHEDIRIVNLRVAGASAHPVGGVIGQDAVLFIDLNHLGESRLGRSGQNFLLRHYQTETVSPIAWNAVLDLVHRTTNNSVLSVSAESLLRVLLRQPTDANMLLFSRPAADAEILVRREALTDNGIDLAIDSLTIEVDYEFAQQSLAQHTLDVKVSDDLQPVIVVSEPDARGRRDGQGSFRRFYSANVILTLEAPAVYGGRPRSLGYQQRAALPRRQFRHLCLDCRHDSGSPLRRHSIDRWRADRRATAGKHHRRAGHHRHLHRHRCRRWPPDVPLAEERRAVVRRRTHQRRDKLNANNLDRRLGRRRRIPS